MNTSRSSRFAERRRHADEAPGWADTVPACFRSECFAEDLMGLPPALDQTPPAQPAIEVALEQPRPAWVATAG